MNVLFVCVRNAGRSQMAEAFMRRAGGGRHESRSAGSHPSSQVHPEVVDVMREIGIDLGARVPRRLDRGDAEWADVVVTMGCGDACPYIPGKRYVDWQLEDPSGQSLKRLRATSGQALAGVVGPLIEVPVLVGLLYVAIWLHRRLRWSGGLRPGHYPGGSNRCPEQRREWCILRSPILVWHWEPDVSSRGPLASASRATTTNAGLPKGDPRTHR